MKSIVLLPQRPQLGRRSFDAQGSNGPGDLRSSRLRMLTKSTVFRPMTRRPATGSIVLFGSALVLLAGCASEPRSYVLSAPPPPAPTAPVAVVAVSPAVSTTTQTTQTTQTTADGTTVTTRTQPVSTVTVTQAPPTPPIELISAQPTSAHAWVPGNWTWTNSQYQWLAGRWEVPPFANAKWMAPRWETESGAYRFYEGYWN